jgi:DNA-binding NarL/FixJ family response regulator
MVGQFEMSWRFGMACDGRWPDDVAVVDRWSGSADPVVRVLVVDDHPAVRMGLFCLFGDQADLEVVDAVPSAEAALALAERERVDVAVVDYQLGWRSGLWLSRMLKRLERPPGVVIYSAYCDGPLAVAAVVGEADWLASKAAVGGELCGVVRAVASGRRSLPAVPPALVDAMRRRLCPEDQAIFGMLLAGIDRAEIAATVGLSRAGLDVRMWAMLDKLEGLQPDLEIAHHPRERRGRRRSRGC